MMRCEVIHDGEIFPNHRVLTILDGLTWLAPGACVSSDTLTTENDCVIT
jgi:hypothetical protein